ncbi:MAG: DUF2271 domain-containing protein [Cellvibrionaceae bacterium]
MKNTSDKKTTLKIAILITLSISWLSPNIVFAEESVNKLEVAFSLPKLDVDPYHRPYVAVWVETLERKPVATLAVWHEKDTWLKDLRQWWRKIGRRGDGNLDEVTGATRKPGQYVVAWNGVDSKGNLVAPGEYLLNIESVREEGGRSYSREKINIGTNATIEIAPDLELGKVIIKTF